MQCCGAATGAHPLPKLSVRLTDPLCCIQVDPEDGLNPAPVLCTGEEGSCQRLAGLDSEVPGEAAAGISDSKQGQTTCWTRIMISTQIGLPWRYSASTLPVPMC